jgi:hypothetical protein
MRSIAEAYVNRVLIVVHDPKRNFLFRGIGSF